MSSVQQNVIKHKVGLLNLAAELGNRERNYYTYDDKGERVIKVSRQGETAYINQYYVVRNRSIVSKH